MAAFFKYLFVYFVLTVDDGGKENFKKFILTVKTDIYSEAKAGWIQTLHLLNVFQIL